MVRVWWSKLREWCVGEIERVMPASIQVYYEDSDTFSAHRLKSTQIVAADQLAATAAAATAAQGGEEEELAPTAAPPQRGQLASTATTAAAELASTTAAELASTTAAAELASTTAAELASTTAAEQQQPLASVAAAAGAQQPPSAAAAPQQLTSSAEQQQLAPASSAQQDDEAATIGIAMEASLAGGKPVAEVASSKRQIHGPPAPKTLEECGFEPGERRWRPNSSGTLWRMLTCWTSGACGLYLYIKLSILALSSDQLFHAMNWAMGSDPTPRLLQKDGSFKPLPDGRLACQLPDKSLAFLRNLHLARDCWIETYSRELELASHLESQYKEEIEESIPAAYGEAIDKYKTHLISYQMLPNSLGRLSEPTGPAFLRAFVCVFFPSIGKECSFDDLEVTDEDCVQGDSGILLDLLSVAIAEADEPRQQFLHQRLFQLAILHTAEAVEKQHLEEVKRRNDAEYQERLAAARAEGKSTDGVSRRAQRKPDKVEAVRLKAKSIADRQCHTLGFKEKCGLDEAGLPNAFLQQVLRVAQVGTNPACREIAWGEECRCDGGQKALLGNNASRCWCTVNDLYRFLEAEFFHLFIHQMWVEGAFNRLDHNQCNSGADLMEATLLGKMNGDTDTNVDEQKVRERAKEIKGEKHAKKLDTETRSNNLLDSMCDKQTKARKKKENK